MRVDNPVLEMSLFFRNRMFTFSNLAALIGYIGIIAVTFLLSLYLQFIKGFDPDLAGLILAVQTIFMVIMSPIAGKLSDMFDPGKLASLGMAIITIAMIIFAFLTDETSLYIIILGLIILGIGIGIFSAPNMKSIMGSVDIKYVSVASSNSRYHETFRPNVWNGNDISNICGLYWGYSIYSTKLSRTINQY